jgi:UDP-N-acetylmuramyl pentapeptide phosphotransferase/UDP-N-acetylglucosamine-1-phosphate transferase
MRKISFVIAAMALILTAGVGGWVASTTAHDRAANVENHRGGTPVGGGLFVMPPVN